MNMSFIAQRFCRQHAARAALALLIGQFSASRVRLARCRSREPRGPVETEGKIKGPARIRPQSQSARGLGTARLLAADVPSQNANLQGIEAGRVPPSLRYAYLRWSLCHGFS